MDTIKNNREEFKWHQLPSNSDGNYNVTRKGLDSSWRKTSTQNKTSKACDDIFILQTKPVLDPVGSALDI